MSTPSCSSVSLRATDYPNDSELVLRARRGEELALSMLIERYQKPAYALALSVTGRHEDAEDVAQESFLVALEQLDECRIPERFAGWFMTIVRNRSRNLIRRESLRETSDLPRGTRSRIPTPDKIAETSELRGILQQAIASLPEVQQQVVLLHDLEGWKHREIAERLGLPSGTVRSHLHFARKALKGALARMPGGPDLIRKVQ
ncbi:MAG TPA: sigma-70 family RNA polymerase sigma factor [Gemmatimonadetes bacterium]|nr:sigma-70 family RNA polymerase sigma factor [Gemmatimonadota bacterium]